MFQLIFNFWCLFTEQTPIAWIKMLGWILITLIQNAIQCNQHWITLLIYICMCVCSILWNSLNPPQTPFTFGLNQRAPYTAGDRCLLCRCERKDSVVPSEADISGQNGTAQLGNTPSALQLPLWVCSDCRRTVEKEDRRTTLEQSLGVSQMGMLQRNLCRPKFDRLKCYTCVIPLLHYSSFHISAV